MRVVYNAGLLFALSAIQAMAATTGLPWERPFEKIADSITGPVAFGLGTTAMAVSALSMAFHHGDMSDFGRYAARGGLVVGAGVLAVPVVTNVMGVTGALI